MVTRLTKRTLWIILDEMDLMWVPENKSWMLNERHYGALQGLNKAEMAAQYGEEQVQIWRRSFDIPPTPMEDTDARYYQRSRTGKGSSSPPTATHCARS